MSEISPSEEKTKGFGIKHAEANLNITHQLHDFDLCHLIITLSLTIKGKQYLLPRVGRQRSFPWMAYGDQDI